MRVSGEDTARDVRERIAARLGAEPQEAAKWRLAIMPMRSIVYLDDPNCVIAALRDNVREAPPWCGLWVQDLGRPAGKALLGCLRCTARTYSLLGCTAAM